MLVQRDQCPQRLRIERVEQEDIGRPVAREHLVRHQRVDSGGIEAACLEFGARLGFVLASHQRLGLGKDVGHQRAMVTGDATIVGDRRQHIGRHQLGALVQQLIEGVLAGDPDLTEQDRAGRVVNHAALAIHALAVALHVGSRIGRAVRLRRKAIPRLGTEEIAEQMPSMP